MRTTSAVMLTVAVVAVGRWARNQKLDMRVVLAIAFVALMIALLQEGNTKFAEGMATLILVGAVAVYGRDIFEKFNQGSKAVGHARKFI